MNKEIYLDDLITFLKQFIGKSTEELFELLGITSNAKSKNYIIAKGLLSLYQGGSKAKLNFEYFNIKMKTIQLNEKDNPKEAMSLPPIDFMKIINETWEESVFYNYIKSDFLFFVFKTNQKVNKLIKIIRWKICSEDINGEIKSVWNDAKNKLKEGNLINEIKNNGKIITMFLGEKTTNICHVRPHARDGSDIAKLPVADINTGYEHLVKHSFWFNHKYLSKIVQEGEN